MKLVPPFLGHDESGPNAVPKGDRIKKKKKVIFTIHFLNSCLEWYMGIGLS